MTGQGSIAVDDRPCDARQHCQVCLRAALCRNSSINTHDRHPRQWSEHDSSLPYFLLGTYTFRNPGYKLLINNLTT